MSARPREVSAPHTPRQTTTSAAGLSDAAASVPPAPGQATVSAQLHARRPRARHRPQASASTQLAGPRRSASTLLLLGVQQHRHRAVYSVGGHRRGDVPPARGGDEIWSRDLFAGSDGPRRRCHSTAARSTMICGAKSTMSAPAIGSTLHSASTLTEWELDVTDAGPSALRRRAGRTLRGRAPFEATSYWVGEVAPWGR